MRRKIVKLASASSLAPNPIRPTREALRSRGQTPLRQESELATRQIPSLLESWMRVCKVRQMSPKTTSERQRVLGKLHSFAIEQGHSYLSRLLIESFLAQIAQAGGLRPVSVGSYFRILRTFCNWLVEEEYVEASPMAKIKPPVARPDQVEPLTSAQIQQLLAGGVSPILCLLS